MSSKELDLHRNKQQEIVENFHAVLVGDVWEAEKLLEELDEDTSIDSNTYKACRELLEDEHESFKFWSHESYVTELQKHD